MSLTPQQIFEDKIATRLSENPDVAEKINVAYQFKLTGDDGGDWAVDLREPPGAVTAGVVDGSDITITMEASHFVDLVEGRLNGQMAFMTGKLKIDGNPALALKLQQLFG